MTGAPRLIVALDFDNQNDAMRIIDQLDPAYCGLKIGSELFTRLGPQFVSSLVAKKFKIFLDLKFYDIPNTVSKACKACADLGVWMINVHALGGFEMMNAAHQAVQSYGEDRPLLIAVTILTSYKEDDLASLGFNNSINKQVNHLAKLANDADLDGVVCSAFEAKTVKELCGANFITVTPGIRWGDNPNNDQARVMSPKQALDAGSDYLVIGRPITQAANPLGVVTEVLHDMNHFYV